MGKIKLTESQFKQLIVEIGHKYAAKALDYSGRDRNTHNKAMISLFSKYIGSRNLPFYVKIMDGQPTRYELIEVNMSPNFDSVKFYFDNVNDDAEYTNAPYSPNKKDIIISYDIKNDNYEGIYGKLSPYFSNFLTNAAKTLKETYFSKYKVTPEDYNSYKLDKDNNNEMPYYNDVSKNPRYQQDTNDLTDKAKQTKYNKRSFNTFDYDSGNLLNKG
jgi:hypothetical protein